MRNLTGLLVIQAYNLPRIKSQFDVWGATRSIALSIPLGALSAIFHPTSQKIKSDNFRTEFNMFVLVYYYRRNKYAYPEKAQN